MNSSVRMLDGQISIDEQMVGYLVAECAGFSGALGLQMGNTHAPCTLHPVPLPQSEYDRGVRLAPLFNAMNDGIERDATFLTDTLRRTAESDSFIGQLMAIYQEVGPNPRQPYSLYLDRSDYMLHEGSFKQVELNTISSAFAALSCRIGRLHRLLYTDRLQVSFAQNSADVVFAMALAKAIAVFNEPHAHVLMIVQAHESNSIDQRVLQILLWERHGVKLIRQTLEQVEQRGKLAPSTQNLCINDILCGVVYFRAGYSPRDYPNPKCWSARLLIEQSSAIKCPSIAHQLAGSKKIQQVLCNPGCVERFVGENEACEIRQVFAHQWSLDFTDSCSQAVNDTITMVSNNPDRFVMKPQREGGGNNFFGVTMKEKLVTMDSDERPQYILMERLNAPTNPSIFVKEGIPIRVQESISEFGFYSAWLSDGKTVVVDQFAGHLVRTKAVGVNEGGVASGFSVLDSLVLTQ